MLSFVQLRGLLLKTLALILAATAGSASLSSLTAVPLKLPTAVGPGCEELGSPVYKESRWLARSAASHLLDRDGVVALAFIDVGYGNQP
jgi:hypothetical protein